MPRGSRAGAHSLIVPAWSSINHCAKSSPVFGKFTGLTQEGIFHHASEVISCGMAASSGSSPFASMISNHSFRRDAGSGLPHQGQCLISTKLDPPSRTSMPYSRNFGLVLAGSSVGNEARLPFTKSRNMSLPWSGRTLDCWRWPFCRCSTMLQNMQAPGHPSRFASKQLTPRSSSTYRTKDLLSHPRSACEFSSASIGFPGLNIKPPEPVSACL